MQKQTHRHKQSFTLIELLIVIAIIAILAAVIVANVTSAQAQARDVRRTQDLDQLKTALEMYYLNNDSYPHGDIGPDNADSDDGFCIEEAQGFKEDLVDGDYISSLPQDPLYNSSQCSDPSNTDCHCYIYRTETADKYKLFAKVEQQDFKPATQDGGPYNDRYEAYAPVQGANQIVLGWAWYEAGPYLSGIVGAWSFDEGFGTIAYDTSGNNNHGTLINGPTWVDGKFGKALQFDGVNDYLNCGNDASLNITTTFTHEAWVKFNNLPSNPYNPDVFAKEGTGGYEPFRMDFTISDINLQLSDSPSHRVFSHYNITWNMGQWYHIVTTFDNGTVKFYINGSLQSSVNSGITSIYVSSGPLYLGARGPFTTSFLNGIIDEARIYNRALSAEEIADLYAAGGD